MNPIVSNPTPAPPLAPLNEKVSKGGRIVSAPTPIPAPPDGPPARVVLEGWPRIRLRWAVILYVIGSVLMTRAAWLAGGQVDAVATAGLLFLLAAFVNKTERSRRPE